MLITDFEKKLQDEIDKDLNIRVNPNADDIAGVYWKDAYVGVAVPSKEIFEELNRTYTDKLGNPYRTIQMAFDLVSAKLQKTKDNYELLTTKI